MDNTRELLEKFKAGNVSVDEVLHTIKKQPFEDIGYANIDFHRSVRQGASEVIFGMNKSADQIVGILRKMLDNDLKNIIVTRLSAEKYSLVNERIALTYYSDARIAIANEVKETQPKGNIVIVSAGTSDICVCEEAAVTAEALGSRVTRIYDVGVSGLHRLLARLDDLIDARVVIAVAGMEGALASVVGGLVDKPVIAVPTSVGYGSNFEGLSALLSMLNSCASGVSVVNIDNGFGAGYLANMINKM